MADGALLMAAVRDASLFNSPGRAGRYHVIVDGAAACNQTGEWSHSAMPLVLDRAQSAASVTPVLRCRRSACARLWPHDATCANG